MSDCFWCRFTRVILDYKAVRISGCCCCSRCSDAGNLCFFDFSGYEPYLIAYDHFVGDTNAIYVVVVSAKDSATEQRRQFCFWLDYLRSHMVLAEPVGMCVCGGGVQCDL